MEEPIGDGIAEADDEETREKYQKGWREQRDTPERRAEMVENLAENVGIGD